MLEYLAEVLAQTEGETFHRFLCRAAVFRQPVEQAAFEMLMDFRDGESPSPHLSHQGRGTESSPPPVGEAEGGRAPSPHLSRQGRGTESSPPLVGGSGGGRTQAVQALLEKGVTLALFEREAHQGQTPVYWVTPVIRDGQWAHLTDNERHDCHQRVYCWYDERLSAAETQIPDDLEEAIHHALESGNIRAACRYTIDLGTHLREILLYRECLHIQQSVANQIDETVITEGIQEKDENVATLLNELGYILNTLGKPCKAITYYEQALAIDRAVYGNAHPNVAIDLNNLGCAWDDLDKHRKAIDYYEQALAIDRAVSGDACSKIAIRLNNLGLAWHDLGEHHKAIDYYEQALAIDRAVYDNAHPAVARDLSNLGRTLKTLGDIQKAREYCTQALEILTTVYGPDHPLTRMVQKNLDIL